MSLTPFQSKIFADVGIAFGDEGKGRLIYELIDELVAATGQPDPVGVVMKVNGGANSGHTAGGLKLNLLPCGVCAPSVRHLVIGAGVVADPRKFLWEGKPLESRGYAIFDRLRIDERTIVSDVFHRLLDLAWEDYRVKVLGETARGSTGRGISPAYGDETAHLQFVYADFRGSREDYARRLAHKAARALDTIRHVCRVDEATWNGFFDTLTRAEIRANAEAIQAGVFTEAEFDFTRFRGAAPFTVNLDAIVDAYWTAGQALVRCVTDVRETLRDCLRSGRNVIGEFGQSYWLDKRHGFVPNVTASHTFSPEIFQSAGLPVQPVHTLGVCKAYDTKVGTHRFITEMTEGHPLTEKLKRMEFGTSTGRQRMVGWFDAVEKGDALRYGGCQDIMINKVDALSYSGDWQGGELLVCTAYRDPEGNVVRTVPRDDAFRARLKPIYLALPGWSEDLSGIRSFAQLPANARRYIAWLVKASLDIAFRDGYPADKDLPNLRYVGVGPDPSQIIKDVPSTADLLKEAR